MGNVSNSNPVVAFVPVARGGNDAAAIVRAEWLNLRTGRRKTDEAESMHRFRGGKDLS